MKTVVTSSVNSSFILAVFSLILQAKMSDFCDFQAKFRENRTFRTSDTPQKMTGADIFPTRLPQKSDISVITQAPRSMAHCPHFSLKILQE